MQWHELRWAAPLGLQLFGACWLALTGDRSGSGWAGLAVVSLLFWLGYACCWSEHLGVTVQ